MPGERNLLLHASIFAMMVTHLPVASELYTSQQIDENSAKFPRGARAGHHA
jgi:hypothetical protein